MTTPDFITAREYILTKLEKNLSPQLFYHSVAHTRDDVLPAAERLAEMEGIRGESLLLLRTAACYHDAGFLEQYSSNEDIAVRMAGEALPGFGYSPQQVRLVQEIILATRMPQDPHNPLEQVMADADLDSLGRQDYWELRVALRKEHEVFLGPVSDADWHFSQLEFIRNHHYFTNSAKQLRDGVKQEHILELIEIVKRNGFH